MNLSSLIEAALRTLLAALAVGAGLRLLRISNVLAQKKAWMLVLAAALAMPLVMRWQWLSSAALIRVPAYPWAQRVDSQPTEKAAAPVSYTAQAVLPKADSVPLLAEHSAAPASSPWVESAPDVSAKMDSRPISIATLLWFLYLGVCALLLARLLFGLLATARLWTTAEPVSLAWEFDLPAGLRLRSSRRIVSPVALAAGVVLPADFAQWDQQKLRVVLAHEHAHILQHDFYLQTLAGLHAALFWFSPLSWWLKRKLSDLGEAISDRAGLEAAASRSTYAQILLEFAALPRPTSSLGVAMAHSSNLSNRIERFLNESLFHQAFAESRRRALLAVLLVPSILFASTALIRVKAAAQSTAQSTADQTPPPPLPPSASEMLPPPPPPPPPGQDSSSFHGPNTNKGPGFFCAASLDGHPFAVITGSKHENCFPGVVSVASPHHAIDLNQLLAKAHMLAKGKFLWFNSDEQSFYIDDPALVAQMEEITRQMDSLGLQQEQLGGEQDQLSAQMEKLSRQLPEISIHEAEIYKEMDKLNQEIETLEAQQDQNKTPEEWVVLQSKIGNLEGKIGALEGQIVGAKKASEFAKMRELMEKMGALRTQMGQLGARQRALVAEAESSMMGIIGQARKEGKARPVE
jgi:beta-lactamase regulating signal transducer with metallopeptidase domain